MHHGSSRSSRLHSYRRQLDPGHREGAGRSGLVYLSRAEGPDAAGCWSGATARPFATRFSGSRCFSASASGATAWWGSAWAIIPFLLYGVIYGSTVRFPLARIEPRHGLQDRLDEQRAVRDRLVHGDARGDRLALEPQSPSQRHDHRRAAIPRSPCRVRPTCPSSSSASVGVPAAIAYFKTRLHPLHGPAHAPTSARSFPASEYGKVVLAGPALCADLRGRDRPGALLAEHPAADVHRAAAISTARG